MSEFACGRCDNLGILRVSNDEEMLFALCACACNWASLSSVRFWDLPVINREIENAFRIERCPLTWFLPDNERESVPHGQVIPSMGKAIGEWKTRMRNAREFWANWGEIFDEGKSL